MERTAPATIVLGLGNLVHTDDGVGVHAIQSLQKDPRVPHGVTLMDGGTLGLALLHRIPGSCRLLVIDAVHASEAPGTVFRFEGAALKGLPGKASIHQLGFADLMIALQLTGEEPGEVVILGIQPESTEWGETLTPQVRKALTTVVDCAIAQLQMWSADPSPLRD
jgi:hydrogenase maturation protease